MFCEFCGQEVKNNAEFCPHCGMALENDSSGSFMDRFSGMRNRTTYSEPTLNPPRYGANTTGTAVKNDIALAEGEVIVKRYNCADTMSARGYLTVTNKRLMFNAKGGSSRYNQEVTLSSVSGITCHKGLNINWMLVIIGAIMILLGFSLMAMISNMFGEYGGGGGGTGIFIIIGGLFLFFGIRPAFQIAVYAKDVSLSPIVVGQGPKSLLGNSALFAFASKPTEETEIMINELGALIQDLQSMGDLAIEKWQNSYGRNDIPLM